MVASTLPMTDLASAQQIAILHESKPALTVREAIGRFSETARLCLESLDAGQWVTAQELLEDSLIQTLLAMRSLDVNPDHALRRGLTRLEKGTERRAFHIFADRVEIRVHDDIRGEWPIYTQADYDNALKLAYELGCNVVHKDGQQLGLFGPLPERAENFLQQSLELSAS